MHTLNSFRAYGGFDLNRLVGFRLIPLEPVVGKGPSTTTTGNKLSSFEMLELGLIVAVMRRNAVVLVSLS